MRLHRTITDLSADSVQDAIEPKVERPRNVLAEGSQSKNFEQSWVSVWFLLEGSGQLAHPYLSRSTARSCVFEGRMTADVCNESEKRMVSLL